MVEFLQTILNGISVGSSYALLGLGLTVIYSVYRLLNLAHAEFYMLGGFATFFTVSYLGLPFWLGTIIAMIMTGILGVILELVVYRQFMRRSGFDQLIGTIGLLFLMENVALYFFTSNPRSIVSPVGNSTVRLGGLAISGHRLLIIVVTLVLVLLLYYFNARTKTGKQMRAVAQDRDAAQLMGIDIVRMGQIAFFVSCALAAVAGALMGSLMQVTPAMGFNPLLYAMVVVILGGLGSNFGAIVGGLSIGIIQSMAVTYVSSALSDILVYVLLFIILLLKPTGLFGGKVYA